jgi:tRNA (guanine-N7-)-methyltransferase
MDNIKSYVIRAARMSDHQKEAYQRLYSRYCIPVGPAGHDTADDDKVSVRPVSGVELESLTQLDWESVFPHRRGRMRPIILDIGFGMGNELAELADQWRDRDFLGVEVHKPGVGKLLGELERRNLDNVRIIRYDAVAVCRRLIPPGTLAGVHLFFPDPWPKKRHHKRRLVRAGFPEMIAPLLSPDGGYLYVVTDWEDYALQMRSVLDNSVLDNSSLLVNSCTQDGLEGFAPPRPWRPRTAFERKGLQKGHRIFELHYERNPGAGTVTGSGAVSRSSE